MWKNIVGLAVVHPTAMNKGCYVRIGTFRCMFRDENIPQTDYEDKFLHPRWEPFNWNLPDKDWGPKVIADDFVSMEWRDGREWGTIEIY